MQSKLSYLRKLLGISQEQLASDINIPVEIIKQLESGSLSPYYNYLVKIADFFHITTDSLLYCKKPDVFGVSPPVGDRQELFRIYMSLDEISKGKLYARAVAISEELTEKKA